jgi:hypothetical protein
MIWDNFFKTAEKNFGSLDVGSKINYFTLTFLWIFI